jgi:acetolactate synthase-1/2/3 large subunit
MTYPPEETLSGAEILIHSLEKEKVEYIFGYPGGAVLYLYDELAKQDRIRHILVRHEQGAVHAADGYARATGRPGVALVTSGPGLTNAVTGIATAYMDSIPLVVISGQVPTSMIGLDAFQEVDAVGITRPCVKHNFLVKNVEDIASTIKKAFYIATTGRPGPVLVDIPKDISAMRTVFQYPERIHLRSYKPEREINEQALKTALQWILKAKRPIFYTGGGVVLGNAAEELTALVRALGMPITNTLMGLGAYPGQDPLFLGMLGMHGTYEANMAVHHSDLLIAVGARFDDRVTGDVRKFCPYAKIIHIDVDPSSISKNVQVHLPVIGDAKKALATLHQLLQQSHERPNPEHLESWWRQINDWRKRDCLRYKHDATIIKPQLVLEKFYEVSEGNAIVTSDVGQHQMWAAQFYRFKRPRQWLNSGGLGTMGYGLPAAMGAKIACPDELVACVTGEASIQMCIQELSTCFQYRLPLKIILLNNGYMGMVRQWQEFFHGSRYAESYMDALPDFVALAKSYGHAGMSIDNPGDVEGALKEALAMKDRLVFLDFKVDPTENVYPMVPAGKGMDEMILI